MVGMLDLTSLGQSDRPADIEQLCERFFGHPMRVTVEELGTAGEARSNGASRAGSPEVAAEARRQRQEALQHPAVNDARDVLGAEILEIRPAVERTPGNRA